MLYETECREFLRTNDLKILIIIYTRKYFIKNVLEERERPTRSRDEFDACL
jgi:hypothetical protein